MKEGPLRLLFTPTSSTTDPAKADPAVVASKVNKSRRVNNDFFILIIPFIFKTSGREKITSSSVCSRFRASNGGNHVKLEGINRYPDPKLKIDFSSLR